MTELNESIKELKDQISTLIKDYYGEIRTIWIKLTELETRQKTAFYISGLIIGVLSSTLTIIISLILKKYI